MKFLLGTAVKIPFYFPIWYLLGRYDVPFWAGMITILLVTLGDEVARGAQSIMNNPNRTRRMAR